MKFISNDAQEIQDELSQGMTLKKCRQCGCMQDTLNSLESIIQNDYVKRKLDIVTNVSQWQKQMNPIKYDCFGCEHCYPAVATNMFYEIFPDTSMKDSQVCSSNEQLITRNSFNKDWPVVPGEYFVLCEDASCPVAVSTLSSPDLAEKLADHKPKGLCIVGKTETENIGIEKVVKNTITNPSLCYLILAGKEPEKHCSGNTLLSLWQNGVDGRMKVIDSTGTRPIFKNVTLEEVEAFRKQVEVVNMIDCEDIDHIIAKIGELTERNRPFSRDQLRNEKTKLPKAINIPIINAIKPTKVQMDKAGYFVIFPLSDCGIIRAEQYAYDNTLLRVIEGKTAKEIYGTIIENKWVTQLIHAAYLGKELTRAELSLTYRLKYDQDGA